MKAARSELSTEEPIIRISQTTFDDESETYQLHRWGSTLILAYALALKNKTKTESKIFVSTIHRALNHAARRFRLLAIIVSIFASLCLACFCSLVGMKRRFFEEEAGMLREDDGMEIFITTKCMQ